MGEGRTRGAPTGLLPPRGSGRDPQHHYRNRIFHSGFIDFETYDVDNAVAFIGHLSDVLIRIAFHLLGFQSRYRAPCGAYGMALHETPDWPTRQTLSGHLLRYVD